MKPIVLIVEDDQLMSDSLKKVLNGEGFSAISAATGAEAKMLIEDSVVHLVLLDIRLPDTDGLDLLKVIKEFEPDIPILVMTAYSDVTVAVNAMKKGATDYIQKPFELDELKFIVHRALEDSKLKSELTTLRRARGAEHTEIVGRSPKMRALKELIDVVAETPRTPVLVVGESGTGKELVAAAIHRASDRKDAPLVKINVSAIPENLLESEFFGYKKGAFTDAKENKKGLFELAHGGTLFLDEVGEMQLSLQPKLLRFLETQSFNPIGGVKEIKVDVRVITATNQDLSLLVSQGRFRDDLYYRLKVMVIEVPPLRDRAEDIPELIDLFLSMANKELRKNILSVSREAQDILMNYNWPGNVRELKNVIERAVILSHSDELDVENLPMELVSGGEAQMGVDLKKISEVERDYIKKVLYHTSGNKSEAAKILGISRSTLFEKLRKYELD
ncbi:MAG: sigma-54-dependent Fis family transcriptional regulator [Deltaproteobacteria bacterium]|uniref:Sigma-54-dependent Fis family transcriptional regulator n=1 Tax=Candidatus Zymogenus saltonus TaxID=2844893 RepID=A0A9D8PND0_9DELT|nr:sigma-54-dependent Fis family transcriptional regulator [Candidatus Zymogenus saltonus]